MKNNSVRFLAIAAVLVMLFSTAAFAENPYQDCFYEIPSVGIIGSQTQGKEIMSSPDKGGESIGKLDPSTIFRILGRYNRQWYLVDLTLFDGFEAEYGFINSNWIVENPSWLMMQIRTRRPESRWPVSSDSYTGGLIPILDENDDFYKSLTRDHFSFYNVMKTSVEQFSEEGQELYLIPFSTPLFDENHTETGEIPGFTIVEIAGETTENYIPIKANPGKEDEFSGWIMNQTLLRIIN